MDNNNPVKELNAIEEKELREGQALYEMTQSAGWQVIEEWLKDRAYHAWVDPKGMPKEDWEWAELNAYHAANNARELLEDINKAISKADYLDKVKSGEIAVKGFKI